MEEFKMRRGETSFLSKIILRHNKVIVTLFLLLSLLCILVMLESGLWVEKSLYTVYSREGDKEYENILKGYGGESDIYIILSGGRKNVEAYGLDIKEKLKQAKEFKELIKDVNIYNKDLEFLRRHGFKVWDKDYVFKAVEQYKPRGIGGYLKSYRSSYEEGPYNEEGAGRFRIGLYEELLRIRRLLVILKEYIEEPENVSVEDAAEELANVALFGETLNIGADVNYLLLRVGVNIIDRHEGQEQIKRVQNYVKTESKAVEGLKIYSAGARGYYKEDGKLTSINPLVIMLLLEIIILIYILLWRGFRGGVLYVISSQIQLTIYLIYITKKLMGEINVLGILVILVLNVYSYITGLRFSTEYEEERKRLWGIRVTLESLLTYKGKRFIVYSICLCGFYLGTLLQESQVLIEVGVLVSFGLILNMVLVIFYISSLHILLDKGRLRSMPIWGMGIKKGGDNLLEKAQKRFAGEMGVGISGRKFIYLGFLLLLVLVAVWILVNKGEERYKDLESRVSYEEEHGGDGDRFFAKLLKDKFKIGQTDYLIRELSGGEGLDLADNQFGDGFLLEGYEVDSIRDYLAKKSLQSRNMEKVKELKKELKHLGSKDKAEGMGELGEELRKLIQQLDEVVRVYILKGKNKEGDAAKVIKLGDEIKEKQLEILDVIKEKDAENKEKELQRLSKFFKKEMEKKVKVLLKDDELLTLGTLDASIKSRYINKGRELIRLRDVKGEARGNWNGKANKLKAEKATNLHYVSNKLILEEGIEKVLEGSIKWFWYGQMILFVLLYVLGRSLKESMLMVVIFLLVSLMQLGAQEQYGIKYNYINYIVQMLLLLIGYTYIYNWLEIGLIGASKDLNILRQKKLLEELLLEEVVVILNIFVLYVLLEGKWSDSVLPIILLWQIVYLLLGFVQLYFYKNRVTNCFKEAGEKV